MSTTTIEFESSESASPAITRLLGSFLAGQRADVFEFADWEKAGLKVLNLLPVAMARMAVRWRFKTSSLEPGNAAAIKTADLVDARLRDYKAVTSKKFPAVIIGAAMGGASAHLAAVLGVPFLPQPFILGLRGGSPRDELGPHLELTTGVARQILARNPELMAIAHFDPIHDGWLTRVVSHLRLKLITLPAGYQDFIHQILEPGGMILYLDCEARWLQYELGPRHHYQVGGWGAIPAEEYILGSPRIDRALELARSPHRGGWSLDGLDPTVMPESEWGSEPGFDVSLASFAGQEGYRFGRLVGADPHEFSTLAFQSHYQHYHSTGRAPQGVVVETFTQYDPGLILRAGLLPLWLIFNTEDSLEFLRSSSRDFPSGLPVFFSGLVTLSRTPDMVPWSDWADVLGDFEMYNIGARPQRYPEDLESLWSWSERLRQKTDPLEWVAEPGSLELDAFLTLAETLDMVR